MARAPIKPRKSKPIVTQGSMEVVRLPNVQIQPLTPQQEADLRKKQAIRRFPTTSI